MLKQYCSALEMIMIMKISVTFRIFVSRFIDIEVLIYFADQVAKRDSIMPHEEYHDGKWAVSGTSHCG